MKRILFATDGSDASLAAGRYLSHWPHRRNVHVHIVVVLPTKDPETGAAILEAARESLGPFPGHITTATSRGDSTSEVIDILLATAEYADADLIAVGANGKGAIERFFIGSVAEGLARQADRPVLIARDAPDRSPDVVVGIDGSDLSRKAALLIGANTPPDRRIHLVQVLSTPIYPGFAPEPILSQAFYDAAQESADAERTKDSAYLSDLAWDMGDRRVDQLIVTGDPVIEILRTAEGTHAGLIAIGAHGTSGVKRLLIGSVSEQIVRHAPCSVLLVRPMPRSSEDAVADRSDGQRTPVAA